MLSAAGFWQRPKIPRADAGACFLCFFPVCLSQTTSHFDVCAVCVHDPAEMPPGAADCDNVCAADACSESGEHADAGRESAESVSFTASPVPGWVNLSDGWRRIRSCQVCFCCLSCSCSVRASAGSRWRRGHFCRRPEQPAGRKRDLSGALCAKPAFGSAGASVGADARRGAHCTHFYGSRGVFLQVDYCLLFTFISFFIFIGNMGGNIEAVRSVLQKSCGGQGNWRSASVRARSSAMFPRPCFWQILRTI